MIWGWRRGVAVEPENVTEQIDLLDVVDPGEFSGIRKLRFARRRVWIVRRQPDRIADRIVRERIIAEFVSGGEQIAGLTG